MYKYDIDLIVRPEGCPDCGLEAIDWRERHGLPPAPTSEVHVVLTGEDPVVRQWSELLNSEADLILKHKATGISRFDFDRGVPYKEAARNAIVPDDDYIARDYGAPSLPVDAIKAGLAGDLTHFVSVLAARSARVTKLRKQQEAEREAEQRRRKEAEEAQVKKQIEAEQRAKRALEQERNAWIKQHGSRRLKRMLEEGIKCNGVYRDERLALERPNWCWLPSDMNLYEPVNAPEEAFDLLDEARQDDPAAELAYFRIDDEDGGEGYVAVTNFLGNRIVTRRTV